jgi:hypothetical protein
MMPPMATPPPARQMLTLRVDDQLKYRLKRYRWLTQTSSLNQAANDALNAYLTRWEAEHLPLLDEPGEPLTA